MIWLTHCVTSLRVASEECLRFYRRDHTTGRTPAHNAVRAEIRREHTDLLICESESCPLSFLALAVDV
jgi:hypothetical protein